MRVVTILLVSCLLASCGAGNIFDDSYARADPPFNSYPPIRYPFLNNDIQIFCANSLSRDFKEVFINDQGCRSKLDLSRKITIFIGGYRASMNKGIYQNLMKTHLDYQPDNICFVEWGRLASAPYTTVARSHTRIVSAYITKWIRTVQNVGCSLINIQMVGHCVGAHIAGLVGADFGGNIGEIVGLDPAGLEFSSPNYRLGYNNAKYVKVIHTGDNYCGSGYNMGHADFYVNGGGKGPQPSCGAEQIVCSHMLAILIYQYSLTPNGNKCIAVSCPTPSHYANRNCDPRVTDYLGPYSGRKYGAFYLATSKDSCCTGNYYQPY